MSTPTTHTPAITSAVIAHGLMALGLHMVENNLSPFADVRFPRPGQPLTRAEECIELHITSAAMPAWAASISPDRVEILPRESTMFPFERRHYGRLPDSGVRVVLVELLEDMPRGLRGLLQVVSS